MLKVYIDTAVKGNPGPAGGGLMITGEGQYIQKSFPLGVLTNHEGEFAMLIKALEYLLEENFQNKTIFVHTDSKTVAQIMEKDHAKNAAFKPFLERFRELEPSFPLLLIQWIPESENKGADHLARQGLQKQLKEKKRK